MKRTLLRTASAVCAAITVATVGFAGPTYAVGACWDTGYGRQCRDFGGYSAGAVKVPSVMHPTFTGILKPGQTLTSTPGEWEKFQALTYQWLLDGEAIPGAVGETYSIPESDTGRSLALRVTATGQAGIEDGVETTLPSPKVSEANTAEYTARPGITGGTPDVWGWTRVGFELSADHDLGTWSPRDIDVTLQWQADGVDIQGANGPTYTPRSADLGKRVTLKVTGGDVSMSNTAEPVTPGHIEPGRDISEGVVQSR